MSAVVVLHCLQECHRGESAKQLLAAYSYQKCVVASAAASGLRLGVTIFEIVKAASTLTLLPNFLVYYYLLI